ncbi:hypothetical protein TCAL_15898 [Tigriopus californicus]|uniref:Uncharacterized protein n=1 Tax=Tigriopus californicus TaxID=6832 RepID=A0A553PHV5_TIGCA|nr:hypothetical protein TCAL_15898 [Tigriopus californicus]
MAVGWGVEWSDISWMDPNGEFEKHGFGGWSNCKLVVLLASIVLLPQLQTNWTCATIMCFVVTTLFMCLVLTATLDSSEGLRYNYGDGSYYIGSVDEYGKPDGIGQYYNSSGDLGMKRA